MIRLSLLLALALSLAGPLRAQVTEFGEFQRAETRFGVVQVTGSAFPRRLAFNGQPTAIEDARIWILGAYAYPGEAADWLLLGQAHGGNMCPVSYRLARVSQGGLFATAPLGDCLGGPLELRVLPGRLELDIADPDLRTSHRTYAWAGSGPLSETVVPAALGQGGGAAPLGVSGAMGLLGKHPGAVLRDPPVQALFLQFMTPDQLEDIRRRVEVANGITQRPDWIFGQGCMAHQCNVNWGIWGIRLADMSVAAAAITRNAPAQIYGSLAAMQDPIWQDEAARAYRR